MTILITGASGFLGQKLLALLKKDNHQLFLLGQHKPLNSKVQFFKADITDKDSLTKVSEQIKIDSIIHLAALVPKTAEEDLAETMFKVNVGGTINLLEIFGSKIKNFVYASTAEVYGLPKVETKIDESIVPAPLSYYGASKLAGELFCRVFGQKNNLPVSILRFSVMYGPRDRINRAVPNFIKKALAGEDLQLYGGEELRDYIHIDDAAEALRLAISKSRDGVFNIGTSRGIAIKEVVALINQRVNKGSTIKLLPRQKTASNLVLDIAKAQKELGFRPKYYFPDKLEEQIKWHAQNSK